VKRILVALSSGLLIAMFSCAPAWAQGTAQISGSVKDQSGAVLPGVEITATQTGTGITRTTVTNETGSYALPNLALGPYRLEAALPGFRTFVQTGIVLQVNSSPVINAVMQIGQVTEEVNVQANATLVETRNSGVGQVIENVRILELPLNGRNVTDLITLAGAAVYTGDSTDKFFSGSPYVSVSGAPQGFGVDYSLDGAQHMNFASGLSMPMPFPDATQEFKVETSGLTSQHGMPSSVSSVVKSGTNEIHGDLFEFVRNDLFNARQYFSPTGSTLKRNQFGGTVGGPVVKNKLFFFGGYQGTTLRADPGNNQAFVPTAAMLAGDWTAFASPACNAGRQVTLRAPFVNNRIDPSIYVKPALNLAGKLPKTNDPCGLVTYGGRTSSSDGQFVGKIDYQQSAKNSLFGRLMIFPQAAKSPFSFQPDNLLLSNTQGYENIAQSYAFGDTYLVGNNTIQSFRLAVNRVGTRRIGTHNFSWCDTGVNIYCGWDSTYLGPMSVTGAFTIGVSISPRENTLRSTMYQLNDDVSLIRGSHQISLGVAADHARFNSYNHFASSGTFTINGQTTGLGMGDLFLGKVATFFQGAPNGHNVKQTFFAFYATDAWKMTPRVTVNYGMRWEPYLPQTITNGQIYTFDINRFHQGLKSSVYKNAPAGMVYPGDPGYPGLKGIHSQWWNFAPRLGLAWDVKGDGSTSVRASYAYGYEFVSGDWRDTYNGHAPFGNRLTLQSPAGGLENPWLGVPGGNPFPYVLNANTVFPPSGIFMSTPYNLRTPHSSSWNLSIQKQVGTDWLASASYIGNQTQHIWTSKPINPAIYIPGGPCTLNGVTYNPCSTTANTDARRILNTERPQDGALMSHVTLNDDGGTQIYHGMLLSVQRRAARGVTVSGNYTWSHCIGPYAMFGAMGPHVDDTYSNPYNRNFDRGNCDTDRRNIFNFTAVADTPQFSNRTLRMAATGWKFSGIYRKSSGSPLNILAGSDRALNGVTGHSPTNPQRVNQILGTPYGNSSARPLSAYLKPVAFALPDLGTLGNMGRNTVRGPATWSLDVAMSRAFNVREGQRLEFRAEAFNLTNSFRPGNPNTTLTSNTFGIIRTALDPRILQFALKYVF
jgi:hypothetical protein